MYSSYSTLQRKQLTKQVLLKMFLFACGNHLQIFF